MQANFSTSTTQGQSANYLGTEFAAKMPKSNSAGSESGLMTVRVSQTHTGPAHERDWDTTKNATDE